MFCGCCYGEKEGGDCNQAVSKVVVVVFSISVSVLVNTVSLSSLRNLTISSLWTSFHEVLKIVEGFLFLPSFGISRPYVM